MINFVYNVQIIYVSNAMKVFNIIRKIIFVQKVNNKFNRNLNAKKKLYVLRILNLLISIVVYVKKVVK